MLEGSGFALGIWLIAFLCGGGTRQKGQRHLIGAIYVALAFSFVLGGPAFFRQAQTNVVMASGGAIYQTGGIGAALLWAVGFCAVSSLFAWIMYRMANRPGATAVSVFHGGPLDGRRLDGGGEIRRFRGVISGRNGAIVYQLRNREVVQHEVLYHMEFAEFVPNQAGDVAQRTNTLVAEIVEEPNKPHQPPAIARRPQPLVVPSSEGPPIADANAKESEGKIPAYIWTIVAGGVVIMVGLPCLVWFAFRPVPSPPPDVKPFPPNGSPIAQDLHRDNRQASGPSIVSQPSKQKPAIQVTPSKQLDPGVGSLAADSPDLKPFSSKEGRFTISFPGVPVQSTESKKTENGHVERHSFSVKHPQGGFYTLNYTDLPENFRGIDDSVTLLDSGRDGIVNTSHAKVVKETNLTLNGYPGRELEIEDSGAIVSCRMYVVRNRVYMLMAIGQGKPATFAATFFKSLELANE